MCSDARSSFSSWNKLPRLYRKTLINSQIIGVRVICFAACYVAINWLLSMGMITSSCFSASFPSVSWLWTIRRFLRWRFKIYTSGRRGKIHQRWSPRTSCEVRFVEWHVKRTGCRSGRNHLAFEDAFNPIIDKCLECIPSWDSGTLRFGDAGLPRKNTHKASAISQVIHKLEKVPRSTFVISDSEDLRFDTSKSSPAHFGVTDRLEDLRGILYDLLLFARAHNIYWYSVYGWPSGFVSWGSKFGRVFCQQLS